MKSKKKAKTRSKSKPRAKSKAHTKSKTHARTGTKAAHPAIVESIPSPNVTLNPALKTCQEVEVDCKRPGQRLGIKSLSIVGLILSDQGRLNLPSSLKSSRKI